RRCSDDHVPVRRATHARQVPYLRGAAVRVPGHGAAALEVLSLRPLALARPVDDAGGPERPARGGRGQARRVKTEFYSFPLRLRGRGPRSDNRIEMRAT